MSYCSTVLSTCTYEGAHESTMYSTAQAAPSHMSAQRGPEKRNIDCAEDRFSCLPLPVSTKRHRSSHGGARRPPSTRALS